MANELTVGLTEKQRLFVEGILAGLTPIRAWEAAGYSKSSERLAMALRAPAVLAAIEIGLRRKLHGELVPLAFGVLQSILKNEEASERVRLDAARITLDRAGFVPVTKAASSEEREPEAMTTAELHALISRLETELGERAKPIPAPSEAQPVEDAEIVTA